MEHIKQDVRVFRCKVIAGYMDSKEEHPLYKDVLCVAMTMTSAIEEVREGYEIITVDDLGKIEFDARFKA